MYVINNWQENMTTEKSNQYYAKLQDIYEQAPVLIDIHSLLVTPPGTSNDSPRRLLAAWGQNLISFLLLEIIRKYPVLNMDMLSCKENEYLQKVSSFIESHIDSKSLFFYQWNGSNDWFLENFYCFPGRLPGNCWKLL